ncbi:hypothetical protein JHD47_01995 [Sulfurimonas sp. SAG-AH-194-L11]|nr:hypothetical protein [Sulfurimonas sp. SAG-AH-194-L11]MDF1876584.1 hypothetical protein [Sulfurimonas sp. SAG-AH-194-L11]
MEYFLKHQQVILRSLGALLLLVGFVIHFWTVPQKGVSPNDRATANLARMQASVKGTPATQKSKSKPDSSKFLDELKSQQEKQIEYFTILMMLLGAGSLGYSFLKKKGSDS